MEAEVQQFLERISALETENNELWLSEIRDEVNRVHESLDRVQGLREAAQDPAANLDTLVEELDGAEEVELQEDSPETQIVELCERLILRPDEPNSRAELEAAIEKLEDAYGLGKPAADDPKGTKKLAVQQETSSSGDQAQSLGEERDTRDRTRDTGVG